MIAKMTATGKVAVIPFKETRCTMRAPPGTRIRNPVPSRIGYDYNPQNPGADQPHQYTERPALEHRGIFAADITQYRPDHVYHPIVTMSMPAYAAAALVI